MGGLVVLQLAGAALDDGAGCARRVRRERGAVLELC